MPGKGTIMSQTYYERQSRLIMLIKEALIRGEMTASEVVAALRKIGFCESNAVNRAREWKAQGIIVLPETDREKKRRFREKESLEKYIERLRHGKKEKI